MLSNKLDWDIANPIWAAELNPIVLNPLNSVSIIQNVSLTAGVNVVNHKLGNKMQGWLIVDIQGPASVYRTGSFNDKTLILTSSAAVVVSLGVF